MKTTIKLLILIMIIFQQTCNMSCKHDTVFLNQPRVEDRTIADYLTANADYSLLVDALIYVDLLDTLRNINKKYTLLAIDNSVWNQLFIYSKDDFEILDKEWLRSVLSYHIIPKRLLFNDIPQNDFNITYKSLFGDILYVNRTKLNAEVSPSGGIEMVSFSGAFVSNDFTVEKSGGTNVEGNYLLKNGVIHNLDKLILYYKGDSLQEFLSARPEFSIFVAGLRKFNLWHKLADSGFHTVFVPENKTFESFGITEEIINSIDATRFNGELLFGSYIWNNKRFLLSDNCFFLNKDHEYWLSQKLNNTHPYFRIISSLDFRNGYGRLNRPFSSIYVGISVINQPLGYAEPGDRPSCARFLGGRIIDFETIGFRCLPYTQDRYSTDLQMENGVVQVINGLLVFPDEALLK
ncbi:fasciclin domain-containing protein [Sphingobacterium humi]|uniref:FAS1 domain-containing protein n=1 Tax=Sphingobacterium humi TaxID=1796905 RepID=A0A6N8L0I4_9SPHI|nr:fasciclin domain-containing protein [Sphingobacterium humi]MVZ62584.1 hypothetical protein [Sphingobacterium humi]